METMKGREGGLLNQILPPRLEDTGLKDCALPPDSIKEAFLRATTAMKSNTSLIFATNFDDNDEGNYFEDPWTTAGANDTLVGLLPKHEDEADSGPCAKEKGNGVPEVGPDNVVVGCEAEERGSDVVVVRGGGGGGGGGGGMGVGVGVGVKDGGGKACVEGLQGLKTQNPLGLDLKIM